jgi:hypothetical protein
MTEAEANPYNARKEWHEPDGPAKESANSIFYEQQEDKATQSEKTEAPKKSSTNYKKRYDDLKKHYDQKVADFKQREQELLAETRINEPSYQPPRSLEDLEKFKEKYPDLYETVESVAHMRSQEQVEGIQKKLQAIEERESQISRREAETALKQRHPDFEDIRGDESFHEWAKAQPEEIQSWIYNNPDNVNLASRAIDFYKMEKGLKINGSSVKSSKQTPKQNAADFVSTKTTTVDAGQPKVWTQREIAALSIDQYDRYEQEIDQAIVEGRVVP